LAGSALFAGIGGAFEGAEAGSALTTSQPAIADAQPSDDAKPQGSADVVTSETSAHASNNARSPVKAVQ